MNRTILHRSLSLPAFVLAAIPVAVAFDFGGILWWTHYVASLVTLVVAIGMFPALLQRDLGSGKALWVLAPIACWCGFAYWQSTTVSTEWGATLSRATGSAYTQWAGELLSNGSSAEASPRNPTNDVARRIAPSVDPASSRHYAALACVLVPYVGSGLLIFRKPEWTKLLLVATSGMVAFHVAYAFWCQIHPEHAIRSPPLGRVDLGFGSFVNRNNAALHLNLGLGASLGVLAWQLASQSRLGQTIDEFDVADMVQLFATKLSIVALITTTLCLAGILACGSRSGLLAGGVGLIALASRFRIRRFKAAALVLLCVCGLVAWLLISPGKETTTIDRVGQINLKTGTGLTENQRWTHWIDSINAAVAYAPTGSGLATYAYAYLPFQAVGTEQWFHHADNLYLELMVEQGVVGCAFAFGIAILLIQSVRKLGRSDDPIDVGLYSAAVFAMTAVALSQIFDFGLVLSSNLLFFALLASAVIARAHASGRDADASSSTKRRLAVHLPVMTLAVAIAIPSTTALHRDALFATELQRAELDYQRHKNDGTKTRALADKLAERCRAYQSPDLYDLTSLAQFQATRLEELSRDDLQDPQEYAEAYAASSLTNRRLQPQTPDSQSGSDQQSILGGFDESLQSAMNSLRLRPLSLKPRSMIVYLDFVHRDRDLTRQTLIQLAELQKGFPEQLLRIGKLAADGAFDDLATDSFRSALALKPQLTANVLETLETKPQISLTDLIPKQPVNQRLAADQVLKRQQAGSPVASDAETYLQNSVAYFQCGELPSRQARSHCHQVLADVHFSLENVDDGIAALKQAAVTLPADYSVRLTLVEKLRQFQMFDEALEEARTGQALFPSNQRFTVLIDVIGKERLRHLDAESQTRSLSRQQN